MSWKCWCLLFLCYVEGSMKFHDILGGQIKYWPVSTKEVHEESVKARNWEFCLSLMSSEFISPLKSTERHFKCVITVITAWEWSLTLWGYLIISTHVTKIPRTIFSFSIFLFMRNEEVAFCWGCVHTCVGETRPDSVTWHQLHVSWLNILPQNLHLKIGDSSKNSCILNKLFHFNPNWHRFGGSL